MNTSVSVSTQMNVINCSHLSYSCTDVLVNSYAIGSQYYTLIRNRKKQTNEYSSQVSFVTYTRHLICLIRWLCIYIMSVLVFKLLQVQSVSVNLQFKNSLVELHKKAPYSIKNVLGEGFIFDSFYGESCMVRKVNGYQFQSKFGYISDMELAPGSSLVTINLISYAYCM